MRTINMSVEFPGISARELYDTYTSPEKHGAALGATAVTGPGAGDEFSFFDGGVRGRNLAFVEGRMVVQSWRGQPWLPEDLDSVLVLAFEDTPGGGRIELTQANVPDGAHDMVNERAWHERYWNAWRRYFGSNQAKG